MSEIRVRVGDQNAIKVISSEYDENFVSTLNDLEDVVIPDPVSEGSYLFFNDEAQRWEPSNEIDGGSY